MKTKSQIVMDSRRKNYDMVSLPLPKGQREIIKAHAVTKGETMNEFIRRAIAETIERDSQNND